MKRRELHALETELETISHANQRNCFSEEWLITSGDELRLKSSECRLSTP
ncbi:hypothetical protein KCP74_19855 [Salmonella enterica subsp. enterica]|nr:hypothetical protein KCP74_19855 [Salmonella enterica subsp. enterica]